MLRIFYGDYEGDNYIWAPDTYFNNVYEDEWVLDELSREMIKDVDGSEVIQADLVKNELFGHQPIEKISGGVKTLILISNDQSHVFNASACGDNCSKWLLEIGKRKDVLVRLGYSMKFDWEGQPVMVENTGRVVKSSKELLFELLEHDLP